SDRYSRIKCVRRGPDNRDPALLRDINEESRGAHRDASRRGADLQRPTQRYGISRGVDYRNRPTAAIGDVDAPTRRTDPDTDRQIADAYLGNNAVARGVDH